MILLMEGRAQPAEHSEAARRITKGYGREGACRSSSDEVLFRF